MKNITIGKYTLESLTTGMYVDPLVIFREYIQNAADAIDEAVKSKLISISEGYINIELDKKNSKIIIEDNGSGITKERAFQILTDIGNSKKRFKSNKGFRGIGRLSGLSYCNKLIFETSAIGQVEKSILTFDSIQLAKLLVPGEYEEYGMEEVLKKITQISYEEEDVNKHYFRVIMEGVSSQFNLLDDEKVCDYIEQVAPLPYDKNKFKFADKINQKLASLNIECHEYNIFIIEGMFKKQLFEPYKELNLVDLKKRLPDQITDVIMHEIWDDAKDKLVAVVWYGKNSLMGTIVEENIKALRVRKAGILIGDRFLLNEVFKEERFNGWVLGEVIIVDEDIIPNARRDDFEKNEEYLFLMKRLQIIGSEISHSIRKASKNRNLVEVKEKNTEKTIRQKNEGSSRNQGNVFKKVDQLLLKIESRKQILSKINSVMRANNIDDDLRKKIISELMR